MDAEQTPSRFPPLISLWAVIGVLSSLSSAIGRLIGYVIESLSDPSLTGIQVAFAVGWTAFMLWSEGYRGFQLGFSPRVAARALAMRNERRVIYVLLAPLVAMGFLNSTTRQKLRTGGVLCAIICLIVLVRQLEQPWRGLVDTGVIAGLGWGIVAVVYWFTRGLRGEPIPAKVEFAS